MMVEIRNMLIDIEIKKLFKGLAEWHGSKALHL